MSREPLYPAGFWLKVFTRAVDLMETWKRNQVSYTPESAFHRARSLEEGLLPQQRFQFMEDL